MKSPLCSHPLRNTISLQLRSHPLLAQLDSTAHAELFGLLLVHEGNRGERLLEQGSCGLQHFFVIEGLLKRVVASPEGREVALHFTGEGGMETCYEAWRQHTGATFAVVCARRSLVASLPMQAWCAFMDRHPAARQAFHEHLLQLGAAIVDHAVALLLLNAPSRVHLFSDRHPELAGCLSRRDVASHLNLSAETLCRLTRRQRPALPA